MQAIPRLYTRFQPQHYDVSLELERQARQFSGQVDLRGVSAQAGSLSLHAKDLDIVEVSVDGQPATWRQAEEDELVVESAAITAGEHAIRLSFRGRITDPMHGLYPCYFEHNGQKKELLATQFESHHAREVFPCVDEPEAKASFTLSLVTEQGVTVLSNTPATSSQPQDGKLVTSFEPTPVMSTYLLAFVVGELQYHESTSQSGVTVRAYATHAQPADSLAFATEFGARVIDFFNEYFATAYPLPKADMVALPDFSSGAMENWGLITYRESTLLVDPRNSSVSQRQYVAAVVTHELSHQWFGNLVTMRWWNDLWLNESFASLMECVAIDSLEPSWDCWLDFASHDTVSAQRRDCLPGVQAVKTEVQHPDEISTLFDPAIVYAKGANVLKMLMHYVGPDRFKAGLQLYFDRHAYGNTESDDLWAALSQASGKDVGQFMSGWIDKSGYPLVSLETTAKGLVLRQKRLLMAGEDSDSRWQIPLFASQPLEPDLLTTASLTIQADLSQPLLLNQGGHGFFVSQYADTSQLHQLLAGGQLAPIDRLRLLHEAILLARGGEQTLTEAVKLLPAYQQETKDAVWDMISLVIGDARRFAEHDEAMEAGLRRLVRELVGPQLARLGTSPRADDSEEDRKLRATILGLAVWAEDQPTVDAMLAIFDNFTHPDQLDVDLRGIVYGAGARWRGEAGYKRLLNLYTGSSSAEERQSLTAGMAATQDQAVISKLIGHITDESIVRPQDVAFWLIYLLRKKQAREPLWEWLTSHWDWIEAKFKSDKSYDDYPRYSASALMGQDWLRRYSDFFMPKKDIALQRAISLGIAEISARTEWFERDEASLKQYLTQKP